MSEGGGKETRRFRVPHVFTIILVLTVLMALASLVIPSGAYDRDEAGRVDKDSFTFDRDLSAEERPEVATPAELPFAILKSPLSGIKDAANIIAFLLIIGGAFKIIDRSGAFVAVIRFTVEKLRGHGYLIIPVSMTVFSIGGAVFGMSEEVIPFVILFVPLVRALGYSRIIGVAIPLIGAGMGFAGAMLNPFTVGVAQGIAGLPPISGWEYRTVIWVVLTTFGITWVSLKARQLRQEPHAPEGHDDSEMSAPWEGLSRTHVLVLFALAAGIAVMVAGIGVYEWYVLEIGAVFLAIGLVAGIVARIPATDIAQGFTEGAKELLPAAMVVGFARGIVLLAGDLRILDPILFGMSSVLEHLPAVVSINAMFVFQSLLNFLVPSGSGQAALTMPIMAPLSELVGLTRQTAVLAFQFGDGFSNLIVPTSAVLMGSLEAGKVSYERWFRFAGPLQVWLFLIGAGFLCLAVMIGYGA